jgi:hypothetical protein
MRLPNAHRRQARIRMNAIRPSRFSMSDKINHDSHSSAVPVDRRLASPRRRLVDNQTCAAQIGGARRLIFELIRYLRQDKGRLTYSWTGASCICEAQLRRKG